MTGRFEPTSVEEIEWPIVRGNRLMGDPVSRTPVNSAVMVDQVKFPTKVMADVTGPDGTVWDRVRIVYRGDGMLQAVSRGNVVFGPTTILNGPFVDRNEAGAYLVPTPEGVYTIVKRQGGGCGCG